MCILCFTDKILNFFSNHIRNRLNKVYLLLYLIYYYTLNIVIKSNHIYSSIAMYFK